MNTLGMRRQQNIVFIIVQYKEIVLIWTDLKFVLFIFIENLIT